MRKTVLNISFKSIIRSSENYEGLTEGKLDTALIAEPANHMQMGMTTKLPVANFRSVDKAIAAGIWKGIS
jgi:hypothetical protein